MKRWARWLAPAFVGAAAFVLTMTAGTAVAKQDGRPVDRVVMFASDGMRPDLMEKYAKAGFMPTYKKLMKDGVTGDNGMRPGLPAEHRRRLVHDGHRHLPVRARLDEQHLLPRRRRVLEPDGVLRRPACCRPTRSRTRPSGRARRSPRSTGSAAPRRTSTARPSTSRTSSRTAACSSAPANAVEQAGSAFFGVTYQVSAAPVAAAGWTGVPAGDPAAPPKETTWAIHVHVRRPEPEPHLQRLLLRQRRRRRRRSTTTRSSARSARPAPRRRSTSRSATSSRSS